MLWNFSYCRTKSIAKHDPHVTADKKRSNQGSAPTRNGNLTKGR